MDRLRWKFVASSWASQRQNSTAPKSDSEARLRSFVGDGHPPHLDRLPGRHQVDGLGADTAPLAADDAVAEPVAAGVAVQVALRRLPARVPVVAADVVAHVEEAAAHVERGVVVAVAEEPSQPCVTDERVAARGVRQEREVVLAAQVVDPWQRRVRPGDDVLPPLVVEVAVLHAILLSGRDAAYAAPPQPVAGDDIAVPEGAVARGACLRLVVHVDETEAHAVAVRPLEVVEQ